MLLFCDNLFTLCDVSFVRRVHFGPFFRKQKGFYLQKSMECKNFEAQYLEIAQNADRTL